MDTKLNIPSKKEKPDFEKLYYKEKIKNLESSLISLTVHNKQMEKELETLRVKYAFMKLQINNPSRRSKEKETDVTDKLTTCAKSFMKAKLEILK